MTKQHSFASQSARQSFRGLSFLSRFLRRGVDVQVEPLLSESQIKALAACLHLDHQKDPAMYTRHLYAGAQQSPHHGEGMDFLENRSYQPGDNPRQINWRLSARLGHLHSKVFEEEKQSQTILVVDRRPSMWFGTCKQLKVRQAVNSAVLFMFAAVLRHHAFASVPIDQSYSAGEFHTGDASALLEARQLARTDNRAALDASCVSLADGLQFVQQAYPAGNNIIIISDFADIDPTISSVMSALAFHNSVAAVYITDPADVELPQAGSIDIVCSLSGETTAIDTADPVLREHYRILGEQKQSEVVQALAGSGVTSVRLDTSQDPWPVLRGLLQ